jgi:trk system potassium uptake protein TrkH
MVVLRSEHTEVRWIHNGLFVLSVYAHSCAAGLRGRVGVWFRDSQVQLFLMLVLSSIAAVVLWLTLTKEMPFWQALVGATFNVSSLISCTGFTSENFSDWGAFPLVLFLLLMLAGGCTGSTAGGIKAFRLVVLFENVKLQVKRQIYPHISSTVVYNGEPIPDLVRAGVINYFFVYVLTFAILSLLLTAAGLTFEEGFSASATALGGVGPGFGPRIGPCCTFATISDPAKWLLVFGMLAGRLEILILFIPLSPIFWRN